MASAIEDVNSLPGETVKDQDGRQIGKVEGIYGVGEQKTPMWVTVKVSTGIGRSRLLFVPLARIKYEHDQIRVPYSVQHVHSAPEVEPDEELSEQDDRALRNYYAIDLGDQELRANSGSYAGLVPDGEGPATRVDGDAGEPQSGKVEGEDREVELKSPGEAREHGKPSDEDGKIADPRGD
jgi:hypothetical protein